MHSSFDNTIYKDHSHNIITFYYIFTLYNHIFYKNKKKYASFLLKFPYFAPYLIDKINNWYCRKF